MKTLKLALLILLISPTCFAQDLDDSKSVAKHYIGFHAGFSTVVGFSYKLIDRHFGIQITGLPTYQDGDVWSSTGLAITYRLNKDLSVERKFIPLIYLGVHHLYEFNKAGDYYYLNDEVTYTSKPQHKVNIAV